MLMSVQISPYLPNPRSQHATQLPLLPPLTSINIHPLLAAGDPAPTPHPHYHPRPRNLRGPNLPPLSPQPHGLCSPSASPPSSGPLPHHSLRPSPNPDQYNPTATNISLRSPSYPQASVILRP